MGTATTMLMDDFTLRALIAGCGLALAMGPLGVFVVWRRMAYFGDTLAHSALLGVALGFAFGVAPITGVIAVCVALALALLLLRRNRVLAEDTLLGVLAHSSLSLGVVAVALVGAVRIDLMSYLFGDILAVSWGEIASIYGGVTLVLIALVFLWRPFLSLTVHEELARVEGVDALRTQIAFMVLIALVIALAMKLVGMLLVTALLILPAACVRRFARTPEQMAVGAALAGCLAVALGIALSFAGNLPTGPAIVVAAAALFVLNLAPVKMGARA
jgi:zinc transport system permease protein